MRCASGDSPRRWCDFCAIDWNINSYFTKCPICGEPTREKCSDEPTPSWSQSKALEAELVAERNALQMAAAQALERTIAAATAALNYDLDRWLEADPQALIASSPWAS